MDAIESLASRGDEASLRHVYRQEYESFEAKSLAVLLEVERLGLEPFQAQQPLPPITRDDVHLICWMAIEAET